MKRQNKQKNKIVNKGFTLIEMLVVVLIIGILAAIALPQYRKTVEKAKVTEGLINFKTIEDGLDRYILTNGYPTNFDSTSGMLLFREIPLDIELTNGEWEEEGQCYITKNFTYCLACTSNDCELTAFRIPYENGYEFYRQINPPSIKYPKRCYTTSTNMGEYICKYLESQGWEYSEGEV